MTDVEKAYIAGLFDGEGTVGYYFKTSLGYHRAQVAIYNYDPRVMVWLRKRLPFGSVVSSNQGKRKKHKGWAWSVNRRRRVESFLRLIRPYLVVKANQVDLLFSLWEAEQQIKQRTGRTVTSELLTLRSRAEADLKDSKTSAFVSLH